MDADDENFFVIGAVEDADLSPLGDTLVSPPKIFVVQFLAAGRLERKDLAALGVHARHYMLDDAVFSGGIHGLKNQQQRPAILGIKFFLHVTEQAYTTLQDVFSVLFALDPICVGGIAV